MKALKRFVKTKIYFHIANWLGYFFYFKEVVYFPKDSMLFKRAIHEGMYEESNVVTIKNFMRQNSIVLDIGANIGLMAIPILKYNVECTVWSFEPSPNSFEYLEKTKNQIHLGHRWQLFNLGVSNKSGEMNFFIAKPENGAFDSMQNTSRTNFIKEIKIKVVTIDEIWENAGKPEISVIKVDIEGADLLALQGGIGCIKKCSPAILVEWNLKNFNPFGLKHDDLLHFCMEINYMCLALPNYILITDANYLKAIMNTTEDFLLIPK